MSSQPQPENKDVNDLWEHFDAKLSERTTNQTSLSSAIIMVKQYNDEELLFLLGEKETDYASTV